MLNKLWFEDLEFEFIGRRGGSVFCEFVCVVESAATKGLMPIPNVFRIISGSLPAFFSPSCAFLLKRSITG